jgi:tetratricopeptide (TPR) repeat protein
MKRRKRILSCVCAAFCLVAVTATFAQSDPRFAAANQEYAAGHFKEAIDGYQAIARAGEWSANLFYNLGNAYFHTGDFGRAILNYERALALDRHHPEARANLQIARDEARALEMTPGKAERFVQFADANQYALAAAITFWVAIFSMAWLIFSRRGSSRAMALSTVSMLVFGLAVLSVFLLENGNKGRGLAVVTAPNLEARLATADNARSVLVLPPGSEIKVLSKRGDWVYAALPNDLRGWVPAGGAEPVRL